MNAQAPSTKYWMHLSNLHYKNRWGTIESAIVSTGPRHSEMWTVTIKHRGVLYTSAAPKKQDAKDAAALQVLQILGVDLTILNG
ncbi:hypothetical protein FRC03_011584 [Tulasnella sp. 419]|nr:hypothetical protein FRC03_011584 [Tulasnella sp. 419]